MLIGIEGTSLPVSKFRGKYCGLLIIRLSHRFPFVRYNLPKSENSDELKNEKKA